ncbi:nuclear transport factor 2 family protein [Pedobacter sp. CFBP9032]|uniref:nuclear transport factor 2 family protein n=1 Tax=Pedobacter sp. CFBP9032 TaxID=3096539 RepID=UPI002A6B3118|nr:nuclear transport factor 2 family protein [Pedobacter sp. CFBP9032]MDY0904787.1 nuclear transport factor 2 family protein [Pedobacter sp. CFBP9032]
MKLTIYVVLVASLLLTGCSLNQNKMTNLEIVKSTYEGKTSEENGKNLAKHVADNLSWTEAKGFPYAGTYIGLDEVTKNVFSRLGSEWIDYKFTPEDYVASDDKVVAYGTYSGTYKITGKPFSARVAHIWKLRDGKIISFEQFVDSQTVNEAMK